MWNKEDKEILGKTLNKFLGAERFGLSNYSKKEIALHKECISFDFSISQIDCLYSEVKKLNNLGLFEIDIKGIESYPSLKSPTFEEIEKMLTPNQKAYQYLTNEGFINKREGPNRNSLFEEREKTYIKHLEISEQAANFMAKLDEEMESSHITLTLRLRKDYKDASNRIVNYSIKDIDKKLEGNVGYEEKDKLWEERKEWMKYAENNGLKLNSFANRINREDKANQRN